MRAWSERVHVYQTLAIVPNLVTKESGSQKSQRGFLHRAASGGVPNRFLISPRALYPLVRKTAIFQRARIPQPAC